MLDGDRTVEIARQELFWNRISILPNPFAMMLKKAIEIIADFDFEKYAEDKKAKVRNRGNCACPAEHPKVNDKKDHFPVNSKNQARNALQRVNQYSKAPSWWDGSLKSLIDCVYRKVRSSYKGIKIDESKKKPGKD